MFNTMKRNIDPHKIISEALFTNIPLMLSILKNELLIFNTHKEDFIVEKCSGATFQIIGH